MSIRQNGVIIAGASQYHPDLFDCKWADHILNDVQWLRADTFSWQDGSVYQAAYNHLVDDASSVATSITVLNTSLGLNETYDRYSDGDITGYFAWILNGVVIYTESPTPSINDSAYVSFSPVKTFDIVSVAGLQSETVAGITIQFYLADDGHKICPDTEASNVASIYLATGVAWYYIIDTVNERFKLPRINPEVVKKKDLPSTLSVGGNGSVIAVTAESADRSIYVDRSSSGSLRVTPNVAANASVYDIKNLIATVPSLTTHYAGGKYLYFYVGAFTQTALENTAGINAELFNDKANVDLDNVSATGKATSVGWVMPDYSAGISLSGWQATNTNFTVPCAGYIQVVMATTGGALEMFYIDDIPCCALINSFTSYVGNAVGGRFIEGGVHTFRSATPSRTQSVIFYPCKGVL